eukprot:506622_1
MCTNQTSTKWMAVTSCPTDIADDTHIPTGMDGNNYIVITCDWWDGKIQNVYKYNIDRNKWTQINGVNDIEHISVGCASLNTKKQILFLLNCDMLTQIRLNSSNMILNYESTRHSEINITSSSRVIVINNSLFIIGGSNNDSILEWNLENKTM